MSRPHRPSRRQIRRHRRAALAVLSLLALAAAYLVLTATVFAPVDRHGTSVSHLTIHSRAVGEDLDVSVLQPPRPAGGPDGRPLLVFLHGRSGSDQTFIEDESVFSGLDKLGPRAPVVAFPDGGDHGYWHDRAEGDWGKYVMREVIPSVTQRFGTDPRRVAIGGISMGGFGAYDLALLHPDRFCAVGGHSPALWFDGGETAPGAFDSAGDFARNDVVGALQSDPDAFGSIPIWNDYGSEDPFQVYDEGFVDALRSGTAKLSSHSWRGGHDNSYWNRHWGAYLRFYADALAHCL
jgi:S-formylglutathione hydrolase FrmB